MPEYFNEEYIFFRLKKSKSRCWISNDLRSFVFSRNTETVCSTTSEMDCAEIWCALVSFNWNIYLCITKASELIQDVL